MAQVVHDPGQASIDELLQEMCTLGRSGEGRRDRRQVFDFLNGYTLTCA